jgi:SAM-dependent methyltransferase
MRTDYSQIFTDTRAVDRYERVVYAPDSYSSAISERQRTYLRRLVRHAFPHRRPVQHDFACGTGRAIKLLHGLVREAHGYDTSPAMLERAQGAGLFAKWHRIEETGPVPEPATPGRPVVVTVFRLLLNVPDPVRERAIAFAAKALPAYQVGLLVVENHGNAGSLRHLLRRRHRDDPWFAELSHHEVEALLRRHGFVVVERRGFTLFPRGAYERRWLCPVVRRVDDALCRFGALARFCTDVLYVARRMTVGQPGDPEAGTTTLEIALDSPVVGSLPGTPPRPGAVTEG